MKDVLEMFDKIPHVRGSFVFDAERRLLCGNGGPLYPDEVLGQAARHIAEAMDFFMQTQAQDATPGWENVVVSFSEGVLLLKSLAKGAVLAVCAQEQVNHQMLRIGANVAAQRLKIPSGPPPAATPPPAAPPPPAPVVAAPPPPAPAPPPVAPPLANRTPARAAAPMDTATQEIADKLTRALAFSLGPVAKVLVKRAVQGLAPDGRLRAEQWDELLRQLEREIDSPSGLAEFRRRIG